MRSLSEHYRLPDSVTSYAIDGCLPNAQGFFRLGEDLVCFGSSSAGTVADSALAPLSDLLEFTSTNGHGLQLPFDADQVIDNLLLERYLGDTAGVESSPLARAAYYAIRPLLATNVRKHLQRAHMASRSKYGFPSWPVDFTVERTRERLLVLAMRAQGLTRLPFIWFWPEGHSSCVTLTHDVETVRGRNFCSRMMDLDEAAGLRSSFQLVPEERYSLSASFLTMIRERGFEIDVHDLNHDGRLFSDYPQFLKRAANINHYAIAMGARGFRSGAMYHKQDWYKALSVEYDMSVPNSGHWEAQFGGCCTVFPYFVGHVLELPLTTVQDYVLFVLWGAYSTEMWKRQANLLLSKHGFISFLTHPDYVLEPRAQRIYEELLEFISSLKQRENAWFCLPGEVNDWWRERSQLNLQRGCDGQWRIEGHGKERARIAYANVVGDDVVYELP
jgi:hypothetical protein